MRIAKSSSNMSLISPPYESRPSIDIDLLALTRYAKELGKQVNELSETELDTFKTTKKL